MLIKIISEGTIQYFDHKQNKFISLNKGDEVEVDDNLLSRMKEGIHYLIAEEPIKDEFPEPPLDEQTPQLQGLSQIQPPLAQTQSLNEDENKLPFDNLPKAESETDTKKKEEGKS